MKKLTIKSFDVVKTPDYIIGEEMIRVMGKRCFNAFSKWMGGQTGILIEGQEAYYPYDVDRFLKGKNSLSH